MFRSSIIPLDVGLCSLQGYLAASLYNYTMGMGLTLSHRINLDPKKAALFLGGIVFTERLFNFLSEYSFPNASTKIKKVLSYSLATYTTMKLMHIFKLYKPLRLWVDIVGVTGLIVLTAGAIKVAVKDHPKPLEQQLQEHAASQTFANRTFTFEEQGTSYQFRIICNPECKEVVFRAGGMGRFSSNDRYILAYDGQLPDTIRSLIERYMTGSRSTFGAINSIKAIDYTANPEVN